MTISSYRMKSPQPEHVKVETYRELDDTTRRTIIGKLRATWSPKQIVGRLYSEKIAFSTTYHRIYAGRIDVPATVLRQKVKRQKPAETRGHIHIGLDGGGEFMRFMAPSRTARDNGPGKEIQRSRSRSPRSTDDRGSVALNLTNCQSKKREKETRTLQKLHKTKV